MSKFQTSATQGMRLDVAIERTLAASGVDRVTEVHLTALRGTLVRSRRDARDSGFGAPSLRDVLLSFAMPRLQHPEVLQAGQHQALLERLSARLLETPADEGEGGAVVALGALAVRRELRRLALLRQNQNSLIEG